MTQYWFKPKRYGYGATPVTWEGWAVTAAFTVLMGGSIIVIEKLVGPANPVGWLVWAVFFTAGVWCFVQFSRRRTEGEWRWRWGNRK